MLVVVTVPLRRPRGFPIRPQDEARSAPLCLRTRQTPPEAYPTGAVSRSEPSGSRHTDAQASSASSSRNGQPSPDRRISRADPPVYPLGKTPGQDTKPPLRPPHRPQSVKSRDQTAPGVGNRVNLRPYCGTRTLLVWFSTPIGWPRPPRRRCITPWPASCPATAIASHPSPQPRLGPPERASAAESASRRRAHPASYGRKNHFKGRRQESC